MRTATPAKGKHSESADRIRAAVINAGVTQREIASHLEVSDVTVSRWLNGWRRPGGENLEYLARFLGVQVSELAE